MNKNETKSIASSTETPEKKLQLTVRRVRIATNIKGGGGNPPDIDSKSWRSN